ncbi:MAG TPA: O-antigen polymerase [Gemmatimonadaceae bacterium]|nr:O-antigen polymerase [Gemmatimonadaceae bacterium]
MDNGISAESRPAVGRFPTSPGILLGAAACLQVLALVEVSFGTTLAAGTWFLVGQFLASLALIRLYDGRWVLQDIRLFFVVFLFLYGATLPLVTTLGLGLPEPGIDGAAFMFGTAFLGFNIVQWWYRQPWHDVPAEVFDRIRPTQLNVVVLILAFIAIIGYAVSRGLDITGAFDRRKNLLLGTQLWVVAIFMMNGLVMYMFAGWQQLSRTTRRWLVVYVALFVAFALSMGNRRDFLPMFIFLFAVVATRRHLVVGIKTLVVGFAVFMLMNVIGIVRMVADNPAILAQLDPVQVLVTQNEFVSPIQTLMYYTLHSHPLRWGMTYLGSPGLFIPRVLWFGKPESLSLQFMRDAFGTIRLMGFAYTPVTEAFLNFGFVGPFVVFSIVSLLMVKLIRAVDEHPGLYFISFAIVVDFNRGEFAGTVYEVTMVGAAYVLMLFVSRLQWAPPRMKTMFAAPPPSTSATSGMARDN